MTWHQSMEHKGPVLRPRCIGTEWAQTQLLLWLCPTQTLLRYPRRIEEKRKNKYINRFKRKNIEGKHFIISVETFFYVARFWYVVFLLPTVRLYPRSNSREKRLSTLSCPSLLVHQRGSQWTDSCEYWYWRLSWKTVEKFHIWLKPVKKHWEVDMKT